MKQIRDAKEVLKSVYGYDSFRPLQEEIIQSLLNGSDTLGIFKTSGGKSLCYQVPAIASEGTAIVISPLISLMKDQVDALEEINIPAAYINSTQSEFDQAQVLKNFSQGKYKLLYVSPERLHDEFLILASKINISFFAIDEAHCISMYGHDFRPMYLKIGAAIQNLEIQKNKRIPRIALTATAPQAVQNDIKELLLMENVNEFLGDFERENIDFTVQYSNNKSDDLFDLIDIYGRNPLIVYCSTVKMVDDLYTAATARGYVVGKYHGKLQSKEKDRNQNSFLEGRINVMFATSAFGMGVDKSDVRTVIHYQLPPNIEAYYQEAGRAGRDGKRSRAIVLYNDSDRGIQDFFIESTYPTIENISNIYNYITYMERANGVIHETLDDISLEAPGNHTIPTLNTILRTLEDVGAIRTQKPVSEKGRWLIETAVDIKSFDEYDFSYILKRKEVALKNLHKMVSYCKIRTCRTTYMMRHFGKKWSEGCDHCDTCLNKKYFLSKETYIPDEFVKNAIQSIQECHGKVVTDYLIEFMRGKSSQILERKGLEKNQLFGSFNTWTSGGIKELIYAIENQGLVNVIDNNYSASNLGKHYLNDETDIKIRLNLTRSSVVTREMIFQTNGELISKSNIKKAVSVKKDIYNEELFVFLKRARAKLGEVYGIQPDIIFSDDMLIKITKSDKIDKNYLLSIGMNEKIHNELADDALKLIELGLKKYGSNDHTLTKAI